MHLLCFEGLCTRRELSFVIRKQEESYRLLPGIFADFQSFIKHDNWFSTAPLNYKSFLNFVLLIITGKNLFPQMF
jgi:hypothetical protein